MYKLYKIFVVIIILIILSGLGAYFYFSNQVDHFTKRYPVWDKTKNSYILNSQKPKSWISLNKISKSARWAIVISEDWAFYDHPGIDFNQLKIVINESIKAKKLVRGASTITQQVVKNSLLSNKRSLFRKLQEMILALMVERKVSKDQILERYLNLIELGRNVYGIKAASFSYYKKHPSLLNAKEGAFLAMLLPSPKKYSQSYRDKRLTKFATEQVSKILVKLRQAHIITEKRRLELEKDSLTFEIIDGIEGFDGDLLSIENESYE